MIVWLVNQKMNHYPERDDKVEAGDPCSPPRSSFIE